MSPASKLKSKLKENSSVRAAKEQQKSPSKHSGPTSTGNSNPGNAYNPVSGTFHSFDTSQLTSSQPPHNNNPHLQNTDETDEHSGSSLGTAAEYDSLSNNGSCSGESEDHKEKAASNVSRQETIPGCDNEKREKIRQKNERKHQRQREKRAHELHERCRGYLISRKLEVLSLQLVAMGISSEKAKLALIFNEGHVEESINWLFEGGNEEEAQKKDVKNVNNLKIDISEELVQVSSLELRYKCSKQEVERSVVACEGDLVKAEEALKILKHEPAIAPTRAEETSNSKQPLKPHENPTKLEREMNYHKGSASVPTISEPGGANNPSSMSFSTIPPMKVAPSSAKMMGPLNTGGPTHDVVGEPVMLMQRPQALNIKQTYVPNNISVSSPGTAEWYANNVLGTDNIKLNGVSLLQKSTVGSSLPGTGNYVSKHLYPQVQSNNRSLGAERQYYPQAQYTQQLFPTNSVDSVARMGSSWGLMGASVPSPSRPVASSLGLFSGWGSNATSGGSSGHMDWNAREMMSLCDYNSIDWTLEANSKASRLNSQLGYHHGSVRVHQGSANGGLQNGGMSAESGGPREWTSPFAGNDIFSLPRQFVTSPSP